MVGGPLVRRPKRSVRLDRPQRLGLYAIGLGAWLSGGLWLFFHYLVAHQGEFGSSRHPLEAWWLMVHGAFAVAVTWMFGLLWGVHVVRGWSSRRRRRSGILLVGLLAWLTLSGYLLYYLGNEHLRATASLLHWSTGLASPVALAAHRLRARSLRRRIGASWTGDDVPPRLRSGWPPELT
jgi:hypothetical protein